MKPRNIPQALRRTNRSFPPWMNPLDGWRNVRDSIACAQNGRMISRKNSMRYKKFQVELL